MNLGPISLRSLSTAFTRSLEAVGLFTVSTPTDLSSVPDIFDRLGDWVESGWEDSSGDELCRSCGKRSGSCKVVIGLRCFWARGGNLSTLKLPEGSECSVLVGRCGKRKKRFYLIRRNVFKVVSMTVQKDSESMLL